MQEPQIVKIDRPFITLGQLLKEQSIIASGGAAKWFLSENEVIINGEIDQRRGRKLYAGDRVQITDIGTFVIQNE
ncbi:S4 domain-containing protein YaaA [Paucilactobacillus kaifaensis]|uniref:S4 domain-containing protein YaaA n=1 Tax=Paucilactobacillus kaifaensis TaxID=2559921 RepID=UPI0010F64876|nr:S4 domain-containing protein YaaA [Paucilactobacillus kaifaensis]